MRNDLNFRDEAAGWDQQLSHEHEQYLLALFATYSDTDIMAWTLPSASKAQPAPAGAHAARLYQIIDLGKQTSTYQGEEKSSRQLLFSWEIAELMEDGRPWTVSQRFTASMGEMARLRKLISDWRGKALSDQEAREFDIETLVGKECLITITHNEKGYANIGSIAKLPTGMPAPKAHNPQRMLVLEPGQFNAEVYAALPDRLRETIAKSPEFAKVSGGVEAITDDIPF